MKEALVRETIQRVLTKARFSEILAEEFERAIMASVKDIWAPSADWKLSDEIRVQVDEAMAVVLATGCYLTLMHGEDSKDGRPKITGSMGEAENNWTWFDVSLHDVVDNALDLTEGDCRVWAEEFESLAAKMRAWERG